MKILYVAPLTPGSTSQQRLRALTEIGHEVTAIDDSPLWLEATRKKLPYRVMNKIFGQGSVDYAKINQQMLSCIKGNNFDLVWIDKGLVIKPETLRKIQALNPGTLLMCYFPDDIGNCSNYGKNFIQSIPYYDFFFIPRAVNIEELQGLGCRNPVLVDLWGFDVYSHRPMELSNEERKQLGGSVGFIGAYEYARAESMCYLARHGITAGIWGNDWREKCPFRHPNLVIKGPSILGDGYAKRICSFDIVLGFLRKGNRDLQTTRTYEVPACGAFMLAERTTDHLRLFEEGKEAEFFDTNEELLEKVRYYLDNEEERRRIARAGRERCLRSGYSNHERLKQILTIVTAKSGLEVLNG